MALWLMDLSPGTVRVPLRPVILIQKFGGYKGELSYLPPTIFKYKGKDYKINELAEIFGNQETRKKQ